MEATDYGGRGGNPSPPEDGRPDDTAGRAWVKDGDIWALGLDLGRYPAGSHRLRCPKCSKRPKDDALGLTVGPNGGVVWSCFRCGFKGGRPGRSHYPYVPRPTIPSPRPKHVNADWDRLSEALGLHRNALPITADDLAGRYLLARGCVLPPADSDLRWIPHHRHPSGWTGPCLVALATDVMTGEARTIHRTWLDPDKLGHKAPVDRPRLLYGGLPKAGSVVRLWADDEVAEGLAIGEGIETCLAAAHGFAPVWATLDAGNLAAFPVLLGIEALTIVADHDAAGMKAAEACAARWHEAGAEVRVWRSPAEGEDAADFLARGAA